MKLTVALFVGMFCVQSPMEAHQTDGYIPSELHFHGSFSHISFSGQGCESLFTPAEYRSNHYLVGPTEKTSVLSFQTEVTGSFLNGITLVGLFGYNNDFLDEKTMAKNGKRYHLAAEGWVDIGFITAEVRVRITDAKSKQFICEARADFNGF